MKLFFNDGCTEAKKVYFYSLLIERIKGKNKGLCSSVIYGPNAAGKTNIIEVMDTLELG